MRLFKIDAFKTVVNKLSCRTGLKKKIISKEVFEREIALCKEMSAKDGGCCWGRCDQCGVVPLLVKLYEGELVDDKDDLKKLRKRLINFNL